MKSEIMQTVLDGLQSVHREGSGYGARCPAHDDRHASLSVAEGDDGRVLLHCHVGCEPEAVCSAIGLKMSELFPVKQNGHSKGRIQKTYDYLNADGSLLYQVVRFIPKGFRQRRSDGKGGWVWKLGDTPRVLYRLPELLAAGPDQWAFIVEGEKDVENLRAVGLTATCNPGGAGKWSKLSDDSELEGRRVAIIADNDKTGRDHASDVANRLHGRVADLRVLELPGVGKDVSDWLAAGGTTNELLALVESTPPFVPAVHEQAVSSSNETGIKPRILIDTAEHRVITQTVAALTSDPDIYQRGPMLVRVLRDHQPQDGIERCTGSPTIDALPQATLRERLTKCAEFYKRVERGDALVETAAHPTQWLVAAVDARGSWPGMRYLKGVSETPVLRADGTIWQTPGYDALTGVLYDPSGLVPEIPRTLTRDQAVRAIRQLLEIVDDFVFESDDHRSAWLVGLLTPLARFAYSGPSPLFLIDANVRGAGKGLLVQTIARIVLDREMPVFSYASDSEEMRKKITSIAIAGDRLVLLDNLEGSFGNDALDRALTSTRWKDRILGKSQLVELPLIPVWYGTGNNVSVAADTARRIIHIRLDVLNEHPEDRKDFAHADLLTWVGTNRGEFLGHALTALSAYCLAGRPTQHLTPFGSFEGWSSLVREAIVWAGMPDPCLTRTRLAEISDTTADALDQLMRAWREYDYVNDGIVVAELLAKLYRRDLPDSSQASTAMRAALENLVGCPPGKIPGARQVGNKIRHFRRRVVGTYYLDSNPNENNRNGVVWRLYSTDMKSVSGDSATLRF